VLMVGIVIDDAIVVLENIYRFINEKGLSPMEAAREATRDIGLAVMATTFSLVVIFLPVSFMSSIAGRFLYQFGITAAVAILVSLVVSFTLTPMMSSKLLSRESEGHSETEGRFFQRVQRWYVGSLNFAMNHRKAVVVIALLVSLSSIPLYYQVKQEFVPGNVDEAEFEVQLTAPEGTNVAVMNEILDVAEKEIQSVRGVQLVLTSSGGSFISGANSGDAYVRIEPHENRTFSFTRLWNETLAFNPLNAFRGNYTQQDVMQDVRRKLAKLSPVRVSIRNLRSFNFGVGGRSDIDFVLRGPDLQLLAKYAEELRQKADDIPGIRDTDTTLKLNKPELRVQIDRDRAAEMGVSTSDVSTSLRLMVGGDEEVSRFRDASLNEDYDVQLRLAEKDRNDPNIINHLFVPSTSGRLIRLDNLVTISRETSPSRIDRLNRERQVSVRASITTGFGLADRMDAIRAAAAGMNLPSAYTTAVSGKGRELERTFREFTWAFLLSIIFMYMILAAQFESILHPVTILLSLPLAIPFALLCQWLTGDTLNLFSALGVLVLFGIVKKNSILQIDHMNNLREAGMTRAEAIIQGNRDRLRPILMTTLTLVAGMIPLALGTGPGAEERRSIAVVVIGGQMLSLLLTLIVTPVAYSLFDDLTLTTIKDALKRVASIRPKLSTPTRPAGSQPDPASEDLR
jgi:hydrophobic/amphiphilic exporter-1 (mainly G- bacteria), HAE1 family